MSLDDDPADLSGPVPEVPELPVRRWTIRRKAAVIEAVRGGWIPLEEACRLYSLSVDEFLAWERDLGLFGIHGLRSTRYQIYRDTELRRRLSPAASQEGRSDQLIRAQPNWDRGATRPSERPR
jgi:hypothetical protein